MIKKLLNKNKKLLISGTLLLFFCISVLTIVYNTTLNVIDKKKFSVYGDEGNFEVSNLTEDNITDVVTLLTGDSELAGKTLKATVENYRNTYLLGVASDFCVYLKGDFKPKESDAEGRVAVGGNIDIKTPWSVPPGYTIGAGDYVTHVDLDTLLKNRTGAATTILGGKLYGNLNDTYYKNRQKYESSNDHSPEEKSTKKLVLNYAELPDDYKNDYTFDTFIPRNSSGDWQKVDQSQTYVAEVLDFDDSFNRLYTISNELVESKKNNNNKITFDDSNPNKKVITFTYAGKETDKKDTVYFNLSREDFDKFKEATIVEFNNIPELPEARDVMDNDGQTVKWNYAYIVVNVLGDGEFHVAVPDGTYTGSKATYINGKVISIDLKQDTPDYSSKNNLPGTSSILYNFNEAQKIVLAGNFQGTILAPHAFITDEKTENNANNYGHLSGALIADSFEGSTEFGYRSFSAPIGIIPGSLKVSKKVNEKNHLDKEKVFNFKVELNRKLTGTYGEMEFVDGIAEFSLKNGESKTANELPTYVTYKVTELQNSGYNIESKNETGKIIEDEEIEVEFINTQLVGDLEVSKKVEGKISDPDRSFHFTVELNDKSITGKFGDMEFVDGVAKFELKDGESKSANNLPDDLVYTVIEENDDLYENSIENESGNIIPGEKLNVTSVSTPLFGNITVTKEVKGFNINNIEAFEFTITLSDKTITGTYGDMEFVDGVAKFELRNGEKIEAIKLPANIEYEVSEKSYSKYKVESSNEKGKIIQGENINIEFINMLSEVKDTHTPNTFDGILLWFILGILSFVSIFIVVLLKKRFLNSK